MQINTNFETGGLALVALFSLSNALFAQASQVTFGSGNHDTSLPIEATSDNLVLNQELGTAVFQGNVVIVQGGLKISGPSIEVFYDEETKLIVRVIANERAKITMDQDTAEANTTNYDALKGVIIMEGDVVISQETNHIFTDYLKAFPHSSVAQLEGRVRIEQK
ncbi:LptA/OstA family protein [uncultured Shimia sp.]|uniref:LptA/OstA family protein n=1 Tax=uncultured Shimia sp. TaxID=573152 RepID=UPI00260E43D3|nr:LptA/OstA family protein [uncultured Shimia sp.]